MNILVVGGAGFIGSHMAKMLVMSGCQVFVVDNLTTGFRENAKYGKLLVGDLSDVDFMEALFTKNKFDAVMHFAASSLVGESVQHPAKYYHNNVVNTLNLLDVMLRHQVRNFIFSSTAATFGEPEYVPIDESHPQNPINPYGASKLMIERILQDYASAYGLNSISLRYFNACGADPDGELGECHEPETHLIPLVLQSASGRRDSITVFGRDYPTPDGACIRDYIHIYDLCVAHEKAMKLLVNGEQQGASSFNLGNGEGYSVQKVLDVAAQVVEKDGRRLTVKEGERRTGDPAVLVADATRASEALGWVPKYPCLETIVEHAWTWEKKLAGLEVLQ